MHQFLGARGFLHRERQPTIVGAESGKGRRGKSGRKGTSTYDRKRGERSYNGLIQGKYAQKGQTKTHGNNEGKLETHPRNYEPGVWSRCSLDKQNKTMEREKANLRGVAGSVRGHQEHVILLLQRKRRENRTQARRNVIPEADEGSGSGRRY